MVTKDHIATYTIFLKLKTALFFGSLMVAITVYIITKVKQPRFIAISWVY